MFFVKDNNKNKNKSTEFSLKLDSYILSLLTVNLKVLRFCYLLRYTYM